MVSLEQRVCMLEKLARILSVMDSCQTIKEISLKTGISTSTIQRYLNRRDLLLQLFDYQDDIVSSLFQAIQIWLLRANLHGHHEGGRISQKRHGYSKRKTGKFCGSGTLK